MIINIIGAGRLGKTIGKLLLTSCPHQVKIGGILCESLSSAIIARDFIGGGTAYSDIKDLPEADINFITTPDDKIKKICGLLANAHNLNGKIVAHCSGSLTSEVLYSAKIKGAKIASIHPIKSFALPKKSIQTFKGTYCAFEGDNSALKTLTPFFKSMGGIIFTINKNEKAIYHAAGVFASNYLITLSYVANECYVKSGVNAKIAKNIVQNIMSSTLANLNTLTHKEALTGPLERGDLNTITNHIDGLRNNPNIANLYKIFAKNTLTLTKHKTSKKNQINQIITD